MASGKYVDNISHAASYECLSMFILLQYLLFYMDQGHYFQGFIGSTCLFIPHSKVKVILTRLYWIYLFIYTTFKGQGHNYKALLDLHVYLYHIQRYWSYFYSYVYLC